MVEAKKLIIGF